MINADRYLHGADPYGKTKFEGTGSILDEIFSKISKCISGLVKPIFDHLEINNIKFQISNLEKKIDNYNKALKRDINEFNRIFTTRIPLYLTHPPDSLPYDQDKDYTDQIHNPLQVNELEYKSEIRKSKSMISLYKFQITALNGRLKEIENPLKVDNTAVNNPPTTPILLPVTEDRDEDLQFRRRFNIPSNGINTPSNRQPTSRVSGAGVFNDDDSDSESEIENSPIVDKNQALTTPHPVTVGTGKNSDAPQSTNDNTGVNPQSNSSDNPSTLLSKNNAAVDNKTITTAKDNKDDDDNDTDDISVNFSYVSHAKAAHKNTNQVSSATGSVKNSDDDTSSSSGDEIENLNLVEQTNNKPDSSSYIEAITGQDDEDDEYSDFEDEIIENYDINANVSENTDLTHQNTETSPIITASKPTHFNTEIKLEEEEEEVFYDANDTDIENECPQTQIETASKNVDIAEINRVITANGGSALKN